MLNSAAAFSCAFWLYSWSLPSPDFPGRALPISLEKPLAKKLRDPAAKRHPVRMIIYKVVF